MPRRDGRRTGTEQTHLHLVDEGDRAAICRLIERWVRARRLELPDWDGIEEWLEPVAVPPDLLATITRHEPWRSAALADAGHWLALPKPMGFGLEVLLDPLPEGRPDGPWERVVAPVPFRTSVADRMDAWSQQVEERPDTWDRVVCEDGAWKVAALWSEPVREAQRAQRAQLVEWARRRRGG